ncbi:MAG: deoxyribonuclease IV, partial [Candidatus Paceibacteria bacterium]
MYIGGHVSISGGYHKAVKRVHDIGGDVVQMFSASPRGWNFPEVSDEEQSAFFEARETYTMPYAYFHASYLINLADTGKIGEMSRRLMQRELNVASQIGVRGSVVHVGSFKDKQAEPELSTEKYEPVLEKLQDILANTPEDTVFIIENMGTRKVGITLEEIGWIIHQVNDDRLKVCLDTCHLHAGGYDITSQDKLNMLLQKADTQFGLDRLEC